MKDNPFDVFSISETWVKPSTSDSEVAIPGYSIVRMDRHGKIGGGTAIYIRDGLPFKTQSDLINNTLENCMVEILQPKAKKLFISCAYRAPNNSVENYITKLENVIHKLPNNSEFILLGDFQPRKPESLASHGAATKTLVQAGHVTPQNLRYF